jgi:serine/threonine-protein kinase
MTPSTLDHVIRTCLAKKPDKRWQTAGDVARGLEWTTEASSQADISSTSRATVRPLVLTGLLLVAAFLGAVVWNLIQPDLLTSSPVSRFIIPLPTEQQSAAHSTLAISPNGRYIAFVGSSQLYLKTIDQFEARPIPGTENARYPFFSPDSEWIGFFAQGVIKKVLVAGGAPVTISGAPTLLDGASWGNDGTIVV